MVGNIRAKLLSNWPPVTTSPTKRPLSLSSITSAFNSYIFGDMGGSLGRAARATIMPYPSW